MPSPTAAKRAGPSSAKSTSAKLKKSAAASAAAVATSASKEPTTTTTTTTTPTSTMIDSRVSLLQVQKALSALHAHFVSRSSKRRGLGQGRDGDDDDDDDEGGEEEGLPRSNKHPSRPIPLPLDATTGADGGLEAIGTEHGFGSSGARSTQAETVWLQVAVKKLSATKMVKPVPISIPHPPFAQGTPTLLLVKDPQRHYKDLLTEHRIRDVTRVVGVAKLRGKFAPFEARRQLMGEHDVFLADDRIVRMLPRLLGSKWFGTRRQPVPVKLTHTKKDKLRNEIRRAMSQTYFMQNKGAQSSIRLGTLSHLTPQQLAENLASALPQVVKRIPGGWSNVQNVEVKTGNSASLPVWNCKLTERFEVEEGGTTAEGVTTLESEEEEGEGEGDEDDEAEQKESMRAKLAKRQPPTTAANKKASKGKAADVQKKKKKDSNRPAAKGAEVASASASAAAPVAKAKAKASKAKSSTSADVKAKALHKKSVAA